MSVETVTTVKCDRCGETTVHNGGWGRIGDIAQCDPSGRDAKIVRRNVDLCRKCYVAVMDFLGKSA
jgi:hypothetical protein